MWVMTSLLGPGQASYLVSLGRNLPPVTGAENLSHSWESTSKALIDKPRRRSQIAWLSDAGKFGSIKWEPYLSGFCFEIEYECSGGEDGSCNNTPSANRRVGYNNMIFFVPSCGLKRFKTIISYKKTKAVDCRNHHPKPSQPNIEASFDCCSKI